MTDTNDKIRSLFMATLMVLSVFAMTVGFAGTAAANHGDETLTNGSTYWQGQDLHYDTGEGQEVDYVIEDSDGQLVRERTTDSSGVALVSTSGLEGSYTLVVQTSTGNTVDFNVAVQDLESQFLDPSVTSGSDVTTDLEVNSNRGTFDVTISEANGKLDGSELAGIFSAEGATNNGDGTVTVTANGDESNTLAADLGGVDPDDYTFEVDVTDTDATDTANLTVREQGEAFLDFENPIVSGDQGDFVEIVVNTENTDSGTVVIGDEANFGYEAVIEVADDDDSGNVTIRMNTYQAGYWDGANWSMGDAYSSANGDNVTVTSETQLNNALDSGDYDISAGLTVDDETDLGNLVINQRSTSSASVWTAPGDTSTDNLDELLNASTETDDIGTDDTLGGDLVIVQVQATGIHGALDVQDFANIQGLDMSIVETNPDPNRLASEFDLSNGTFIADSENGQFFFVFTADDNAMQEGPDVGPAQLDFGDEYEATFTVNEGYLDSTAEDESVSTTFSISERTASFESDPVQVGSGEAQEISGTSTAAPGTSFNVRVRSTGENPFLKTDTVTVDDDGTWTASFDFSDVPEGVEFTATERLTNNGVSGEVTADAGNGDTPTPTPDQGTPTPTETDNGDEGTPTPTEGTEETPGDSPGFGVVAAVLAMLAAALIAVRRD